MTTQKNDTEIHHMIEDLCKENFILKTTISNLQYQLLNFKQAGN